MDLKEDSSRFWDLEASTSRNFSSSSSTFFSANQSPFFSPRSPTTWHIPESTYSKSFQLNNVSRIPEPQNFLQKLENTPASSSGVSTSEQPSCQYGHNNGYREHRERENRRCSSSLATSLNRGRSYDVYIGLHGQKASLLRFANWLRAELEVQGVSCFVSDRARCRNTRKREIVERAMDDSSFGVVILTRKSFRNLYTIEELRFFSGKKNLVPVFFDLGPGDCLFRDIIERRGELWEKHGGELWLVYGGLEKEWKEAINELSRVNDWNLEARDGNWRDCVFKATTLLAIRLGRRSVVERLVKWREEVDKEEFPFPRRENFIGRKKELSELEFILFGDTGSDLGRDYFELKASRPSKKNVSSSGSVEEQFNRNARKGKEPMLWKESEKEIEMMQSGEFVQRRVMMPKRVIRHGRRKRSMQILYGKGIACVSGDSGIGKTELLLEFAYRYHQKYKMVLWVGGESRYIRQNFLNFWSVLGVDVGIEYCPEKTKIKTFEEHEEAAISRVRKELMRSIPYLVVIDNLECEKDWWDHKVIMDLLPRFGGETHVIISTCLPHVMNLVPMKLSYLSEIEALSLMQGSSKKEYSVPEVDALRIIEDKLGRLTFGLSIVGAILSELGIKPTKLLETINCRPLIDFGWSGEENRNHPLRRNTFLLKLFEVCFSIFDLTDGSRSLATRMVHASGWFAPGATPISLLTSVAQKLPTKERHSMRLWKNLLCGCMATQAKRFETTEASSILLRFNIARMSNKKGYIHFHDLVKLYACQRGTITVAHLTVHTIITRGSILNHSQHLWGACFLLFGFRNDPVVFELKVSELMFLVKEVVLPLAIRTFITFSRCGAALELLHHCTNALEAADQAFVAPIEKWMDGSMCWKPVKSGAQLNPLMWQKLALSRATVLETRAKLMLRGGQFDLADDLIRKALFIRTSICGENHPETICARETLSKITRMLANFQVHATP